MDYQHAARAALAAAQQRVKLIDALAAGARKAGYKSLQAAVAALGSTPTPPSPRSPRQRAKKGKQGRFDPTRFKALLKAGRTGAQVAKELGISLSWVAKQKRALGLTRK